MSDSPALEEQEWTPPAPGSEHDLLKPFEGVFKATVKLWMGPGDPMVTTGKMTNSFELIGFFLHQNYVGDPNDGGPCPAFCGKGYWGYNQTDKRYEGFWIDTASSVMQTEVGDVDASGKVWTMIGEMTNPQTGGKMKKRSVITLIDDDHNSMESWFSADGSSEFKNMEIQYVRAS